MRTRGPRSKPVRLRLSRAKGFDLQALSIATNGLSCMVVSRPSRWGNPHHWRDCPTDIGTAEWAQGAAVEAYVEDLAAGRLLFTPAEVKAKLGGYNLACWCALDMPCHADVLLDLANAGDAP